MSRKTIVLITVIRGISALAVGVRLFGTPEFPLDSGASGSWFLPMVIVAALIDSINPCAFSVLLLTIAFLFNIGQVRRQVLRIGFMYIAGLFTMYFLIGVGLLQALNLFNAPHVMAKVGAGIIIVLGGIDLIGYFFPRFPIKLKIPASSHQAMAKLVNRGSLTAVFALGALVGLYEFPCTGGTYNIILGMLYDRSISVTYLNGLGYLILYNLLFVSPLVVILLLASNKELHDRVMNWRKQNLRLMRLYTGLIMVALGLLILFF